MPDTLVSAVKFQCRLSLLCDVCNSGRSEWHTSTHFSTGSLAAEICDAQVKQLFPQISIVFNRGRQHETEDIDTGSFILQ